MEKDTSKRSAFFAALKASVPVLWGYLAIGTTFGCLLTATTGYGWPLALLMSLTVYAGAMQFLAVQLIASGTGIMQIAVITFLVNARHMVYGLSLFDQFDRVGRGKPYAIFALTDEAYALLVGAPPPQGCDPGTYTLCVSWMCHAYWVLGSVLGALLGEFIPFDTRGIDFALTALFLVILEGQWRQFRTKTPFVVGAGCGLVALAIAGPQRMLLVAVAIIAALLIALRPRLEAQLTLQDAASDKEGAA